MDNDIILYETEFPGMYLAEDMGGYFLVDEEGSIYDYDTGDLIQEDVVVLNEVVLNEMNYENIHDKLTKKINDAYNKKKRYL